MVVFVTGKKIIVTLVTTAGLTATGYACDDDSPPPPYPKICDPNLPIVSIAVPFWGYLLGNLFVAAMAMTTSELQAEIEEIDDEIDRATERQRLRRELEELKAELMEQEDLNGSDEAYKGDIDADESGQFVCSSEACSRQPVQGQRKNGVVRASGDACTNFGHQILEGEFTWKLLPMSWLRTALRHERTSVANSTVFFVGGFAFCFVYSPTGGPVMNSTDDDKRRCGSLAIRAYDCAEPMALRYGIYAKNSTGDFVQWGATQDEIHPAHELRAYGPDVHPEGSPPQAIGIFGLTHEQLLQSEWVQDDTLTLKLVLEVRLLGVQVTSQRSEREAVDIPKPTLHRDVQALFEDAASGDVQLLSAC
ncbi:hypothetical protein AK812_SmicGene10458 [Symbiodinium microadriaticum]|uniref:Uncharacterized protein n=1 Tax=Symbiodinium microadriaticum TaxID=2951 RepID=A0A1Q9EFX0_SYMMI|nr:hypothetical protein AK812_SmicGene10458 [Symbiodinium microadriaticum]CAE7038236.1 unnamed protein product [Symbiodinium sp. KB8]CAE7874163.1 unnamed protein product [Symbiodinium microadriaticum]